jgi:hypothetical protein
MTGDNDRLLRKQLLAALAQPPLTEEDVERIFGKVQNRIARDLDDERARAELKQYIEDCLSKARARQADADTADGPVQWREGH